MPTSRLVGADLGSHYGSVEGRAYRLDRGIDQVPVGVGEDHQLPASPVGFRELLLDLGEHRPFRKGPCESLLIAWGQLSAGLVGELKHDSSHHVPVAGCRVRPLHTWSSTHSSTAGSVTN